MDAVTVEQTSLGGYFDERQKAVEARADADTKAKAYEQHQRETTNAAGVKDAAASGGDALTPQAAETSAATVTAGASDAAASAGVPSAFVTDAPEGAANNGLGYTQTQTAAEIAAVAGTAVAASEIVLSDDSMILFNGEKMRASDAFTLKKTMNRHALDAHKAKQEAEAMKESIEGQIEFLNLASQNKVVSVMLTAMRNGVPEDQALAAGLQAANITSLPGLQQSQTPSAPVAPEPPADDDPDYVRKFAVYTAHLSNQPLQQEIASLRTMLENQSKAGQQADAERIQRAAEIEHRRMASAQVFQDFVTPHLPQVTADQQEAVSAFVQQVMAEENISLDPANGVLSTAEARLIALRMRDFVPVLGTQSQAASQQQAAPNQAAQGVAGTNGLPTITRDTLATLAAGLPESEKPNPIQAMPSNTAAPNAQSAQKGLVSADREAFYGSLESLPRGQ